MKGLLVLLLASATGCPGIVAAAQNASLAPARIPTQQPVAPAGIEYWDPLSKGEWRLSYEYQRVERKGNRDGTERMSVDEVAALPAGYTGIPDEMPTDIHTFGLDVAPYERLTLSFKIPIVRHQMRVVQANAAAAGSTYDWEASGIGDLRIVAVVPFMRKNRETLHFHLGFMIPTGSVDFEDEIPGGESLLPYDMQVGGGTWNMLLGLTYLGAWKRMGWGVQAGGVMRFGENDQGYRIGNGYRVTGWLGHDVTDWLSGTVRLAWDKWNNVRGDRSFGPALNPASDGYLRGGGRLGIGPGLSIAVPRLGSQRLSVEMVWPVYQNLDGPQLEQDWTLSTGLSWIF